MEERRSSSTAPQEMQSHATGGKLVRFGRFLVFIFTAGWVFPHVCTEDMDLTKIQNDQTARKP